MEREDSQAIFMARTLGQLSAITEVLAAIVRTLPSSEAIMNTLGKVTAEVDEALSRSGVEFPTEYHRARAQVFEQLRGHL